MPVPSAPPISPSPTATGPGLLDFPPPAPPGVPPAAVGFPPGSTAAQSIQDSGAMGLSLTKLGLQMLAQSHPGLMPMVAPIADQVGRLEPALRQASQAMSGPPGMMASGPPQPGAANLAPPLPGSSANAGSPLPPQTGLLAA